MRVSIGVDVAKEVHWAAAVAEDGRVLLSRRVGNTAEDIGGFVGELQTLGGERLIGVDLYGGIATLISAMLLDAGERLVHVPGLAVNRARQGGVGGQAKSDPKDAKVIADQLRLRPDDFRPVAFQDETLAELRLLTRRRAIWSPIRFGASAECAISSTPFIPIWSGLSILPTPGRSSF